MYIVYKTTNLIDGKYYIGVHKLKEKYDYYLGSGTRLLLAIKKHGKENFIRETLMEFEVEQDAYDYEKLIVDDSLIKNPNCYNITEGGGNPPTLCGEENPFYGKTHTEETLKKISDAHKGHITWMKGKNHTKESKILMSESSKGNPAWNKGIPMSENAKNKLKESTTGILHHRSKIWHIKGSIFYSLKEAGKFFNVERSTISYWCENKDDCYSISKQ